MNDYINALMYYGKSYDEANEIYASHLADNTLYQLAYIVRNYLTSASYKC